MYRWRRRIDGVDISSNISVLISCDRSADVVIVGFEDRAEHHRLTQVRRHFIRCMVVSLFAERSPAASAAARVSAVPQQHRVANHRRFTDIDLISQAEGCHKGGLIVVIEYGIPISASGPCSSMGIFVNTLHQIRTLLHRHPPSITTVPTLLPRRAANASVFMRILHRGSSRRVSR